MSPAATLGDAALLLTAWEHAESVPACAVGAVLLHRVGLVDDLAGALDLPLSTATALLARLYRDTFGATDQALARCPDCGLQLEVDLPLDQLGALPSTPQQASLPGPDGTTMVVRCPTTRDLLEAARSDDPAAAVSARCVQTQDGGSLDPAALDAQQLEAIEATAERLAGAAAAVLSSLCPECGGQVRADVDIAALLWQRVRSEVPAVLAEVAELAAAYGWSETDVLAMSAMRRGVYLELARGGS